MVELERNQFVRGTPEVLPETGGLKIVLIRGLPGSGKSTLAERVSTLFKNTCIVDPDSVDMNGEEYQTFVAKLCQEFPSLDEKFFPYRFLLDRVRKAISEGRDVIWNQPFSDLQGLQSTLNRLKGLVEERGGGCTIAIVEVVMRDANVAFERVRKRVLAKGHGPSFGTFQGFVDRFSSADKLAEENGIVFIQVDGCGDLEENVRRVYNELC